MRPPLIPRPNATSSSSSVAEAGEEGIGPQANVNPLHFFQFSAYFLLSAGSGYSKDGQELDPSNHSRIGAWKKYEPRSPPKSGVSSSRARTSSVFHKDDGSPSVLIMVEAGYMLHYLLPPSFFVL